ncbi:MAG: LVIVD repeat-containing protein [Janthinobacterium lividum]
MKLLLPRSASWALLLGLLAVLACSRQAPQPDDSYLVYASYRPLLMTRSTLESSVAALPPQALHNTGKIYLCGTYVFINEKYEGIHIIDNHDPAHPRPVSFLRIPGNVDMAVRGNLLYADNGPDLVTVDISDPASAKLTSRVRDAFRELPMPEAGPLEEACQPGKRPANAVVVGWRKLAPGEAVPTRSTYPRGGILFFSAGLATTNSTAAASPAGKSGSLARFAVLNQALYTVDNQSLRLFDLQNPAVPVAGTTLPLGFGIETIFPQDHYLFLGTQSGMFIYDVAVPTAPKQLSFYSHTRSCDPVVVDGRYAYVTLRAGSASACGGGTTNVLEVIDLTTLSQPRLARSYPLAGPQGLGAENNRLYVCDEGLKSFDTSRAPELTQLQHFSANVTDVIPNGDYLLAIGPGGLYQYHLAGATLQQVSMLAITPNS